MTRLFTKAFWVATGWALLRTAGAAVVPYIAILLSDPRQGAIQIAINVIPITAVAAISMLAGLPPTDSGPWYSVAFQRAVRQFGQFLLGALPASAGAIIALGLPGIEKLLLAAAASGLATFVIAAIAIIPPPKPPVETLTIINNQALPAPGANEGTAGYVGPDPDPLEEGVPSDL